MALILLLALPMAMTSPSQPPAPFGDPINDSRLAAVVATGSSTTRLSVLVGEQGAMQDQWAGEDQRAALVTWFADNNIQLFANTVLRGG